ncbi:hypothetical protein AHAS_Ahas19G0221000 [Arachis hypogaea]
MAIGGSTSTTSRRRGGRFDGDRLSIKSNTLGGKRCFRKEEHPKCKCGMYAIVTRSQTVENPSRVFFGCPYFKENQPYCDFFHWFDNVFGYVNDNVSDRSELACLNDSIDGVGLHNSLDERVKLMGFRVVNLVVVSNDLMTYNIWSGYDDILVNVALYIYFFLETFRPGVGINVKSLEAVPLDAAAIVFAEIPAG